MSPYRDKVKDREWHREYMRRKKGVKVGGVKPDNPKVDADGNIIYEE